MLRVSQQHQTCCGHQNIKWFQSKSPTTRLIPVVQAAVAFCPFQATNHLTGWVTVILRQIGRSPMIITSCYERSEAEEAAGAFTRSRLRAPMEPAIKPFARSL